MSRSGRDTKALIYFKISDLEVDFLRFKRESWHFWKGFQDKNYQVCMSKLLKVLDFSGSKNFGANLTLNVVSRGFSWEIVFLAKGTQRHTFFGRKNLTCSRFSN